MVGIFGLSRVYYLSLRKKKKMGWNLTGRAKAVRAPCFSWLPSTEKSGKEGERANGWVAWTGWNWSGWDWIGLIEWIEEWIYLMRVDVIVCNMIVNGNATVMDRGVLLKGKCGGWCKRGWYWLLDGQRDWNGKMVTDKRIAISTVQRNYLLDSITFQSIAESDSTKTVREGGESWENVPG